MNYRDEYRQIERDTFWTLPRTLFLGVVLILAFSIVGWLLFWPMNAAKVVQQQYAPEVLLRKYEWFKDASAALDAKRANLTLYEQRLARYDSVGALSRTQEEQIMLWQTEQAGVAASYNDLAAEYNAQMAKFNYRFTNVGDLPQGAETPLPREFKPYINGGVQ